MIPLKVVNNETSSMCSVCKGKCCKKIPGIYISSQFSDFNVDTLSNLLNTGKFAIDWWEGLSPTYYLRPRIKGVGHLKLSKADAHMPQSSYNHLEAVMAKPIRWQRIIDHYDALLQYAVALKLKTAEPAVLLKRFMTENIQSPVYQACLELGRAVRTLHLSHYLHSREMRTEIHEVLNVVEDWNKGNHAIFFGKRGVVCTNDPEDQEIAILSLHLIQSALVYINTLMVQQVLKTEAWKARLTPEDKRALTALFYHHITAYGVYYLDMTKRLKIEDTKP